jgi:hypothetical protein
MTWNQMVYTSTGRHQEERKELAKKLKVKVLERKKRLDIFCPSTPVKQMMLEEEEEEEEENSMLNLSIMILKFNTVAMLSNVKISHV